MSLFIKSTPLCSMSGQQRGLHRSALVHPLAPIYSSALSLTGCLQAKPFVFRFICELSTSRTRRTVCLFRRGKARKGLHQLAPYGDLFRFHRLQQGSISASSTSTLTERIIRFRERTTRNLSFLRTRMP